MTKKPKTVMMTIHMEDVSDADAEEVMDEIGWCVALFENFKAKVSVRVNRAMSDMSSEFVRESKMDALIGGPTRVTGTKGAAEFLTAMGFRQAKRGLDKAHYQGKGPRHKMEGGKRTYTHSDLLEWGEKRKIWRQMRGRE